MHLYSAEEIKLIVSSRAPIEDMIGIALDADSGNEYLEIKLIFRFWPQFKTYIAYPATIEPEDCALVGMSMPDAWFRYLKRSLRKDFGVRHLHNVNLTDNSKRIGERLGLKLI